MEGCGSNLIDTIKKITDRFLTLQFRKTIVSVYVEQKSVIILLVQKQRSSDDVSM